MIKQIICPVQLKDHQKDHVSKVWKSITRHKNFSYGDVSTTGLGKTHTTLTIAWYLQKKFGMKVAIVASNYLSLYSDDSWDSWSTKYGIDVEFKITYDQLRQRRDKVSHPWLVYNHFDQTYSASKQFELLSQNGLFLIFDEYHKTTRLSETHKASSALVRSCNRYRSRCRLALLSFTPGDMPIHYPQILKMMGVIVKRKLSLYDRHSKTHNIKDYGFGDLIKYCVNIDSGFDLSKYLDCKATKKKLLSATKDIYQDYIHKNTVFAMKKPHDKVNVTFTNMFMETRPKDLDIINRGITLLKSSVKWRNGQADDGEWDIGGVFVGLRVIEMGKLNLIAKYIRKESIASPNKKFIVSVGARSIKHQSYLQKVLGKKYITDKSYIALRLCFKHNPLWVKCVDINIFNMICRYLVQCIDPIKPMVMNGETPKRDRTSIIDTFQSPSNDIWCLIVSPGVGGESISLHDKHGGHPRDIIISPDHFHSRLVQTAGRINRVGVKSDCRIIMMYSKEANLETSILDSMVRKSKIAKDLLTKEQKEKFPSEYDYYIEGDRDVELEQKLNLLKAR